MEKPMKTVSYQLSLGPITGQPGEKVTLKSVRLEVAAFRPQRLMTSASDGMLGEIRIIRAGASEVCTANTMPVLYEGDMFEMDVVLPSNGKFLCSFIGPAKMEERR